MVFEPCTLRSRPLANQKVMAPMKGSLAVGANTPNALTTAYCGQRVGRADRYRGHFALTNGLGYPRISGLYNAVQVQSWKLVTDAVQTRDGKTVAQLTHAGRASHLTNLPAAAEVLGPVIGAFPGAKYTDAHGMRAPSPAQLTETSGNAAVAA